MENEPMFKAVLRFYWDHAIKFIVGFWFVISASLYETLPEETIAYSTAAMICGIAAILFLRVQK